MLFMLIKSPQKLFIHLMCVGSTHIIINNDLVNLNSTDQLDRHISYAWI